MNSISVVVPVYNEEKNIKLLVERLFRTFEKLKLEFEIIFIDDHSTDNTRKILRSLLNTGKIYLSIKNGKQGKAFSLLQGFSLAHFDTIIMIDADLQYPPESIPEMLKKMDEGFDVIVADRTKFHSTLLRRIVSRSFLYPFGKLLYGFNCDIQSGFKIFKKEIIERISLHPTQWTFDLEFLVKARNAGYRIASVSVTFTERYGGKTKIKILPASLEIAYSAVRLWFHRNEIVPFHKRQIMQKGNGFHHKGMEFVHFSNLNLHETAYKTLSRFHKKILIALALFSLAGLIINGFVILLFFVAAITFLYFIDLFFNLFLIIKSFSRQREIKITREEIKKLGITDLPFYTILCPLYREWEMLPQFVFAMSRLDYPKEKLQVILLLEEDDVETISHIKTINLPRYIETVIIPDTLPKTKPKALNFGLNKAKGEYVVIYDAEDIPDPKQLKKAVIAFERSGKSVACVQAKLNFYNPRQNLLTRVFAAEYSLWFDLILTGLQSITAPIPLGGTSNHFKTDTIRKLKGWDSFNVTEDCDLGMRLARKGYSTVVMNSLTLEEANSDVKNWFNQRTRWIKGYIQTYLVHMRNPMEFLNGENKWNILSFQLIIGGKILSMFINPLMWLTTVLYFAERSSLGVLIRQFFPSPILYMGVFSLVFGNFLYMYYYMLGCAKRGHYENIRYVFFVPLYWIFMSIAAWKALLQLIHRPHFWPKTIHGFHIDREKALMQSFEYSQYKPSDEEVMRHLREKIIVNPIRNIRLKIRKTYAYFSIAVQRAESNKTWNIHTVSAGTLLILSSMIVNMLNFVFNAFLGRVLSFKDFGLLTLLNAFLYLNTIFTVGLMGTVNHRVAYLSAKTGKKEGRMFFAAVYKKAFTISMVLSVLWIMLTPLTASFFRVTGYLPIILFTPIITFGLLEGVCLGYLQGSFSFIKLGIILIVDALAKFGIAVLVIAAGLNSYAYIPLITNAVFAFSLAYFAVRKYMGDEAFPLMKLKIQRFPRKFFSFNIINTLSSTSFLTLDILLAKHYLTPVLAGEYAFLSLAGKMVFFLGSLFNQFIFPFVGRDEGYRQNTKVTFRRIFFAGSLLSLSVFLGVGVFGRVTMPLLFGNKVFSILPYLGFYASAITLFTISNIFLNYQMAKKKFHFPLVSITISGILALGIIRFHGSIMQIVYVIFFVSLLRLIAMFFLYRFDTQLRFVRRAALDFIEIFRSETKKEKTQDNKAILIFNWRDSKHKFNGGAEVYLHELSKRWVKAGWRVTTFCGNDGISPRYEQMNGVEIFRRGGFYFVYIWAFLYYMFKFRGNYRVIVDSENGIPFFTPLYAKEKIILLIHHVHQEVFRKSLSPVLATVALFLEKTAMPFVYRNTETITVSPSSKEDILKYGLTKSDPRIVFNGVDIEKYKPGKKQERPLVLYVGRLKQYKSLDIFIKSAKQILKRIPRTEFVIAGDGEEKQALTQLTKQMNLQDSITFLGKVSEEKKINLYQRAWVFVNTSFMEGWGITSIEANACGTPVVASRVNGLKDSVKNPSSGYLVKYGSVKEFTEKILLLLEDHTLRKGMSKKAVLWAKNFDWDKSALASLNIML